MPLLFYCAKIFAKTTISRKVNMFLSHEKIIWPRAYFRKLKMCEILLLYPIFDKIMVSHPAPVRHSLIFCNIFSCSLYWRPFNRSYLYKIADYSHWPHLIHRNNYTASSYFVFILIFGFQVMNVCKIFSLTLFWGGVGFWVVALLDAFTKRGPVLCIKQLYRNTIFTFRL